MFEFSLAEYGGVHLAIVDGVADFIANVNKEEETTAIVAFFRELSVRYNTTIVLVIHQNPDGQKERGHLGSELQRKCESMLVITKDEKNNKSALTAKFLRQGDTSKFTAIGYKFNVAKQYHVFVGEDTLTNTQLELMKLARAVFTEPRRHGEAKAKIEELKGCKDSEAKRKLRAMQDENFVLKKEEEKTPIYVLNTEVVN